MYISYLLLFPGEDFAADFGFCKEGVEKAWKNTSLWGKNIPAVHF
jgi:hypothetical protein